MGSRRLWGPPQRACEWYAVVEMLGYCVMAKVSLWKVLCCFCLLSRLEDATSNV